MQIFEDAKKEVLAVNDKLDAKADEVIDAAKAKTGRFTWAVLIGGGLGAVVVIGLFVVF